MCKLILIETSAELCSVAFSEGGRIISSRKSNSPRVHASMTAQYIKDMLDEGGRKVKDFDAVCVSMGPGSYTGLRVGVSTAKGLCFGSGLPLIGIGTLDILVNRAISRSLVPDGCGRIVPMIDARRMEVYTAEFSPEGRQLSEVRPCIVDEGTFSSLKAEAPVLFIGDGVDKCRETIGEDNAVFVQTCPEAEDILGPATRAYKEKRFEDVAYFEPFYLKQFVATVSNKKLF